MGANADNRLQAFADVVTIDAWHKPFSTDVREADLYADVVFGTARVGGEAESAVRFRLSVKRAELVVIIPESEPLAVEPASVSRDTPAISGKLTETLVKAKTGRISAAFSALLGRSSAAKADVSIAGEASLSSRQELEVTSLVQLCLVTQSKTEDGFYRWIVEAQARESLQGRPWEGNKSRLTLLDTRRDRDKGIAPMVRVAVRCRREDLVIDDLELKDEGVWDSIKDKTGFGNRMAAAESYIRDQLIKVGLEVGNIEDKFGRLSLASVIAQPQK